MTDKEIQELAERLVAAVEHLAPGGPSFWTILAALGPLVALIAAVVVFITGHRALTQKSKADDRSEWWKRTQWALEAAASDNEELSAAGNAMIPLMNGHKLISDDDKDLLDTIWKTDSAAADEESAEEFEKLLDAFDEEVVLDDDAEDSDNGSTKEAGDG